MTIHLILPEFSSGCLDDTIPGAREMKAFWRSGDLRDFPENPHIVVVTDWLNRMAVLGGFERELAMLGTDHQSVMDRVLAPAEDGKRSHLVRTHPLILLHCLWRIGVQYEQNGYDDMCRPIADEDYVAARYFWAALLPKLLGRRPKLVFHTADSDFARATRIRLGNSQVSLDQDEISPAILHLGATADFTDLPEDPNWNEIAYLALTIDGYTIAEGLPDIGDIYDWFNRIWEAYLEQNGPLPDDSLHLWLMLFICQRGYLRDRWDFENEDGSPSVIAIGIKNLYQAFRQAITSELKSPKRETPLYLPAKH